MRKLNKRGKILAFGLSMLVAVGMSVVIKDSIHKSKMQELEVTIQEKTEKVDILRHKKINMESAIEFYKEQNQKLEKENDRLKKQVIELNREVKDFRENYLKVEATAYTSYCNTGCIGITATGYDVRDTIKYKGMRIIAVDPNVIPLYSIVMVYPERGKPFKAIALDTGGDIKGNRIDVLTGINKKNKAWAFGRQEVSVRVLKWG